MPPTRAPHDPFITQPPLQPTTSNATSLGPPSSLRSQASTPSLRSNASSASNRARQRATATTTTTGTNLFAPSLSRRPTSSSRSRAAQGVEEGVLADYSDSENDSVGHQRAPQQQRQRGQQLRRVRAHGSPEGRAHRLRAKHSSSYEDEQQEFVNRQPDGGFLLGVSGGFGEGVAAVPAMSVPKTEEEKDQDEVDAHYAAISRQYFTSGGSAVLGKDRKQHEEDLEQLRIPMMMRLREQILQQLEQERWMYEPLDRFQHAVP